VQGYRPGALARHGLAVGDLADRHPHLSVVTLTAWGPTGPWAARRGFDSLVQCPTGIADAEGSKRRPGTLPGQVLDHATGYLAAAAALLALADTAMGGRDGTARLSLAQTAQWLSSAGAPTPSPSQERQADPASWLVTLDGAAVPVQVVGPPGRIGGFEARWAATTEYAADPPVWSPPL